MNEEEIINGCLKKNIKYQRMLFDLYCGKLMSICLRYIHDRPEAEDALQETFIKIFTAIHQYKAEGSFEGWIKRITVNTCLKKLKKRKITFSDLSLSEEEMNVSSSLPLDTIHEKELIRMISNLPQGYRTVFNLHIIEGYTHEEIALILNIKPVTSRSQLIKARRLLQKQILLSQKIIS